MVIKSACSRPSGAHILKSLIFFPPPSFCCQRPARKGHHNHRNWVSLLPRRAACSPRCLHVRDLKLFLLLICCSTGSHGVLWLCTCSCACTIHPFHYTQVLFSYLFIYFCRRRRSLAHLVWADALSAQRRNALSQTSSSLEMWRAKAGNTLQPAKLRSVRIKQPWKVAEPNKSTLCFFGSAAFLEDVFFFLSFFCIRADMQTAGTLENRQTFIHMLLSPVD